MGNNVNPDRKRFRYSGVDRASGSHAQFSTKALAMHCKKAPSFEVVVEHDSHYESGCLFRKQTSAGVLVTLFMCCCLYIKVTR